MCNEEEDHEKELVFVNKKTKTQAKMAWVALSAIIIATLIIFTPAIEIARLVALKEPITWFYISMASIVGAFMGLSGWMSKK
jgi:hypothetical protein